MARNSYGDDSSQSAVSYVNKKGINKLFEAMMTALMVHKPDDHITFIRECLKKAEDNPNHIRWDFFVQKSLSSSLNQKRQKPLPSIEYSKPIIFILSSSSSIQLCSRLLERYHHINYLLINDIANINEDKQIDLKQHEYRYDCIQHAIEQRRSQANGFLIAGELNEEKYLQQWQEKLGRIDLILILSSNKHQITSNQNLHIIQIDSNNNFEDILATTIYYFNELFPQDAFLSQYSPIISIKPNYLNLPILFCIDNHHKSIKENSSLIDDEFEMVNEEENNNSFIYTLCQRLGEEFSFKHIHYGDFSKIFWNFEQLKSEIIESMSRCSGYIIDHFPTSLDDLQRFQSEIGHCSALIYIGEYRTETKSDELNEIIEKFKEDKKAIYVDCRMEVDEIYDDLKIEILEHI